MALLDRVSSELEKVAKRAGQVLDEGRLRMDLLRARRRMDNAARELGYLTYRQAKGEPAPEGEVASLTRKIAAAESEAGTLEAQIAHVRGGRAEAESGGTAQAESAAAPGTPGPSGSDAQVPEPERERPVEPPGAEPTAAQTPEEPRGEAPPV